MSILLCIAAGIALTVHEPVLAFVIGALVLINAGFSFWREYRTEQAMRLLRDLLPLYARVMRNGVETSLPASEVVPGDVLVLAEGDRIPADARVIEEYGLRVNNVILTGEAVPARKTADASLRAGISEIERPNLLFAGTTLVSGTARAIVYNTGMLTQFGRIAHLTQVVREGPSAIQVELKRLTRRIAFIALGIGAVIFFIGAFDVGLGLGKAFILALGSIVAILPEGLPATVTLSLAMAGGRLAQKGILVKKLSVIETLGTISIICTDKSGTLTQNEMTVREVWVAGQVFKISGIGYEPAGKFSPDPAGKPVERDLRKLLTVGMLCNNSRLSPPTALRPRWSYLGDQTEAAMRLVALKRGLDATLLERALPRLHELPFDARRKRMSTIHLAKDLEFWLPASSIQYSASSESMPPEIAFIKGAPREVLQLCQSILIHDQVLPLTGVSS
jgi:magnesium-transporting ATPase (P-type)